MANTFSENVIFVDTDASTFAQAKCIQAIKYIGNTSGTLTIKAGTSSGKVLWEESGATNTFNNVHIQALDGIYVTITNGAKAYVYLK